MPYRAMLWTVMLLAIALLMVALWGRTVAGLLAQAIIDSQHVLIPGSPASSLKSLFVAVLLLSFLLLIMILIVGAAATYREFLRRKPPARLRRRTPYVDAWKLAGQRLMEKPLDE
jgi:hypothetical protein